MLKAVLGFAALLGLAYAMADKEELRRQRAKRHWWEPMLAILSALIVVAFLL